MHGSHATDIVNMGAILDVQCLLESNPLIDLEMRTLGDGHGGYMTGVYFYMLRDENDNRSEHNHHT